MRQDELGEVFGDLRKDAGLSQAALAKKLGISHISIAYYETGERPLTLKALEAYHNYFNVSYDYLMGKTGNANPDNIQIGEILGLSDKSIEALQFKNVKEQFDKGLYSGLEENYYITINSLFESEHFRPFILSLCLLVLQCNLSDPFYHTSEVETFLASNEYKEIDDRLTKYLENNFNILLGEDLISFFKHKTQDDFNNILNSIIGFERSNLHLDVK